MRAATALVSTAIVFIMGLGLSAQALATQVHDPACDPYGNAFGIYEQAIDTPSSHTEHVGSNFTLSGLYCGSLIDIINLGSPSLIDHIDFTVPPGVTVPDPYTVADGAYVGKATINVLGWATTDASLAVNEPVTLRADRTNGADCIDWRYVCYKGVATGPLPGYFWVVGYDNIFTGKLSKLSIKTFHGTGGYGLWGTGYTKISPLTLCEYAGAVGGTSCGGSSNVPLQKNGDASSPDCSNGNGIYSSTATKRDGSVTRPVTTCVEWNKPPPDSGKKHIDELP